MTKPQFSIAEVNYEPRVKKCSCVANKQAHKISYSLTTSPAVLSFPKFYVHFTNAKMFTFFLWCFCNNAYCLEIANMW